MKRLILVVGLIFILNPHLKSQTYVPFPTGNVNWNVFYAGSCDESPPDTVLLRYTIHGDTIINGMQYSKLCLESGDTANPVIHSIGGLREENKKIYYTGQTILGISTDYEVLLYDFTVQVGDTIKHDQSGDFYSVVLDIDSVLIGDSYRKRYKVDNHWFYQNPDYIIEGIGSVKNGLLGHISPITTCGSHYWEHICFRENGVVKYLNPSYSECFPSNLLNEVNNVDYEAKIKIYPNPFEDKINIENDIDKNDMTLKLIDVYGRTLIEKKINESNVTLKLNLKPGLYNALFVDRDGKILMSKKLIKR